MNPGDIMLSGADRNFVALRRGGLLEMGANKLCQRVFIPIGNIIRDIAQRYEILSIPGELKFECDANEDHEDGKAPTRLRIKVKKYANDDDTLAEMLMGEDPDQPGTGVIAFQIFDSSLPTKLASCKIEIKETGDITCNMAKGGLTITAKTITLTGIQNVTISAGTALSLAAPQLTIACSSGGGGISFPGDGTVGIRSSKISMQSSDVSLCDGATEPSVKGRTLMNWVLNHRHFVPGVGFTVAVDPSQWASFGECLSTKVKVG